MADDAEESRWWSSSSSELAGRLRESEATSERLAGENAELRRDLDDAELAMHELRDQFHVEQGSELRQLQRELDNTARDCRLLHFKVMRLLQLRFPEHDSSTIQPGVKVGRH